MAHDVTTFFSFIRKGSPLRLKGCTFGELEAVGFFGVWEGTKELRSYGYLKSSG